MPQVLADATPWVILAVGIVSLGSALLLPIPASAETGIPMRIGLPIAILLIVGLAAAAPIGSIPLTGGMILMNVAWAVTLVRNGQAGVSRSTDRG